MSDVQNSGTNAPQQEPNPVQDVDQTASQTAQENSESPRAWYMSPWFWGILFFVIVLALLAWLFWHQWQAHTARQGQHEASILEQQGQNTALEAEIARLKALLAQEPCIIKEHLQGQEGEPLQLPRGDAKTKQSPSLPPASESTPAPATTAEAPPPHVPTTPEQQSTPSTMAQKLEAATVLVLSQEPSGLQMGTGFFIAPGIVLTNQHVVGSGKGSIYVVGTFEGTATKAKVMVISPNSKRDYAVLQVPVTNVAPLALNTEVQRTQKISTWGFPSAVTDNDPKFKNLMSGSDSKAPDVIYSEGTVSVIQDQNPSLIVHTAIVSQGNSGGPLVNENGDVVGINTYIQMDKQSYRQSSLSIVAKDIIAFLEEHNIPYTLATAPKE